MKTRNELVHEVGDIVSDSIFSSGNSAEVIEYMANFTEFITSILEVLKHELVYALKSTGLDINKLYNIAKEVTVEWHS